MALHKKDNRSYICSQCPKKFNTLAGLTAHLKTHPWLKCPMCDKVKHKTIFYCHYTFK